MVRTNGVLISLMAAIALLVAPLIANREEGGFTAWPDPVSLGPLVNSDFGDFGMTVSRDGLSLYFQSARPGGFGGTDIWVAHRASEDGPWGPAENLGPAINTEFNETTPRLSIDGHGLYFASNRPGGLGGSDLYVSRRRSVRDDFAWEDPEHLGNGVNSPSNEGGPAPFEDDATGTTTLYFFSNRPGGMGGPDIYASTLQPDEAFGPAVLVEELSSPFGDIVPTIRRDGLEMLITSNRPGSLPFPPPFAGRSNDVWVSTRTTTADPWSTPTTLGPTLNTHFNDGWTAFSFDALTLYFATCVPGDPCEMTLDLDLYASTRTQLRGGPR